MPSTLMEEQKECNTMASEFQDGTIVNSIHRFQFVKLGPSPDEIEKEEAAKKYQLLTLARSRISEDIDQRLADENKINRKLMWYTQQDRYIQYKRQSINNLERRLGKVVEPSLPTNSVPRTTGFLRLPEEDARMPVIPDRKRCQKKLIKKGRMDMDYLQRIPEELLSLKESSGMTSSGTQEVNDLIKSMAQRIQHGNKNRVDEMRMYMKMRNVKETKEMYTVPKPDPPSNWYSIKIRSKYDVDLKRALQHKIKIHLDDIEDMKMDMKGRKARVARLKSELELARKSSSCLRKKLEDVNSKRMEAYKRAYELGELKEGLIQ